MITNLQFSEYCNILDLFYVCVFFLWFGLHFVYIHVLNWLLGFQREVVADPDATLELLKKKPQGIRELKIYRG